MGHKKQLLNESRNPIQDFFENEYITLDVRCCIRVGYNDVTSDNVKLLKRDIRKRMKREFAKELNKQLNDQL